MLYTDKKTSGKFPRTFKNRAWLLIVSLLFVACGKEKEMGESVDSLPYGRYMLTNVDSYVEIPHNEALNPAAGITLEGWVRLDNTAGSNLLMSKKTAYREEGFLVDVRKRDGQSRLYSYMGYSGSEQKAGNFPIHTWIHWAVTSDGSRRRHYINGEPAGDFVEETGAFSPSSAPLFLAKTVPRNTGFAEFRLWNVARSQSEVKQTMNLNIKKPRPGLVAVWPLHENAGDVIGSHHGILHNNPQFKKWEE